MSLSTLFSRKHSSNESSTLPGGKMNRGKEIVRGKLLMTRKGKTSKCQLCELVVYCATHDCQQAGQIEIFEEINRTYQKPKKVFALTEIAPSGVQGGSPCSSLSSSPGNSFMGTSPSSSTTAGQLWPFQIVLKNGDIFEFFAELPEDQKQWIKRLQLLLMFPYSPIPEEPLHNPIKEGYRAKLKPIDYKADSVWPVYILPEEVGSRVHVLGHHIISLRSRKSENQPGQLDIISPADPTSPIITWDRDKMRRTGCLGNMVFIEIGRRCRGGPGLLWMYAGPKDTAALRETLRTFLFEGDGRAVPISTQPGNREFTSRASFDSGFPPSYHKRGGSSSNQSPSINTPQRHLTPQRQLSIDSQGSDSGHPSSPFGSLNPPPVDMDSHPSRQKSYPRVIGRPYENNDLPSQNNGSRRSSEISDTPPISLDSAIDDDTDQFLLDSDMHTSPPENSVLNSSDSSHRLSMHISSPSQRSSHLKRSQSMAATYQSSSSGEYERMIHPKSTDTYIQMKPAGMPLRTESCPTRSSSDSPPRSLHPITEGEVTSDHDEKDYVNYPFTSNMSDENFTYYAKEYENMEIFKKEMKSFSEGEFTHTKNYENTEPLHEGSPSLHRCGSYGRTCMDKELVPRIRSLSPPDCTNVRHVRVQ